MRAAAALALLLLAACPRLPPAAERVHAQVVTVELDGDRLVARLRVDAGGALDVVAVDWALAEGERDLVRGRAGSLAIAIVPPAGMRPGRLVRLRGAVHLDGEGGPLLAPFDELARVR